MKQFNLKTKSVKSLFLLLALLLGGTSPTWAQKSLPYSYGFEDNNLATDGWTKAGNSNSSSSIGTNYAKTGSYGFRFYYDSNTSDSNPQCLISPELSISANASNIKVSFYYKTAGSYGPETFKVGYSTTDASVSSFTWDETVSTSVTAWTLYETSVSIPVGTKYIAIAYTATNKYYLYVDDINITCDINGPALSVYDGETGISSGYSYNFGLATAGTTKEFTLSNPGSEAAPVSVSHTGNFDAALSATSIPAGGSVTLTVTMPDTTGDDVITISSTSPAIASFVINVSGTIRDANKVYLDFADGNLPDGWSWVATGSYASSYPCSVSEGYISWSQYGGSSYAWAFTSPKLNFEKDELIAFETARYGSSTYYSPSITVEYSLDGTTWTAIGSAFTDDVYGTWTKRSVTIPVEGVKYIRFNGWYIHMRNIYGGEVPNEPKMVVTQPTTLAFGAADKDAKAPTKTFTIANTGLATLEGINVTSGNAAFTISNAPATLAAGESQEVTITMATATVGNLSSEITVSATGYTGDDAVKFTVTGTVMPTGLSVIDFNDNQLPARWENTGWTFSNGAAYAKNNTPAYVMTTPKIVVNAGDMFVIKGKIEYNSSSYYVTVKGLNSNSEEVYSRKLTNDVFNNTDFTATLLSDVPATVEKLQFVGYYGYIDEIQGINYAAALSVTTGDPAEAVSTPANYDFGECAADATVTYNFANAGAGTINITNVAITGDGAAAYSTNWTTSVAAPFDLTITRTYNAERTTAQAAVVTVTTSEGAFVINVTGTDKAANAPELAVSTNAIDFGKVTADAVETVTVTNNGTGSMTVDIASDNAAFEVSAAQLTEIGAGESKTFDITFKYGTPYGVKNGNVTVTPTYDATAAQTITVTGKAKDPNVWSEDFASNTLPTGWDAGTNWTIADGVAKGTWSSTASYLTTAPLTVSATTDELTFDYVTTAGNVSITIQMSKDGGAWETCAATPAIPTYMANGTAGTAILTGFEPGNYQFRFKNDDYNLDNFEGFVLNLPDHMASITEYTIPASSSYSVTMKEGQSFDATVTVKESRGVAEELTAKLYMGEEVIGTKTGSVAANGTETLTITCTPTVAAPEGAEMHIEVEWAGTKMTTETVTRYVAAITNLTLDETSSDAVVAGTYDKVTLKRKFNAGWNTVCLPFTISNVEGFFGAGAKAYEFSGYTDEGALSFSTVSTLTASYPYVVYAPTAITENIELTNITIASNDASAWYTRKTDSSYNAAYFRGTYAPIAANGWTKNDDSDIIYGVTSDGHIKKAGASASIKGFSAYFDLPAGAAAPSISFDDTTTGITSLTPALSEGEEAVYNLNGQKVQKAQKGLYIVNGRKVVIK